MKAILWRRRANGLPPAARNGVRVIATCALLAIAVQPTVAATVIDAASGQRQTCAVTAAGTVACWSHYDLPAEVPGFGGALAVDVGEADQRSFMPGSHACALATGGAVHCWGHNGSGQLGDGSTTDRASPVLVTGLSSGATAVSAGERHTCAVVNGGAKCWGGNGDGQLGDGSGVDSATPVDVAGLTSGVVAIDAAARHTCVLTTTGGVKCWGKNLQGQLGDGTTIARATPVDVQNLASGVVAIATTGSVGNAERGSSCALTTAGDVTCWGSDFALPGVMVDVTWLPDDVVAIALGSWGLCGLDAGGTVTCDDSSYAGPYEPFGTPITAITVGAQGYCGLSAGGELRCSLVGYPNGVGPLAPTGFSPGCVLGLGDADGDAICDSVDPCANDDARHVFAARPKPRFIVQNADDLTTGDEALQLNASFALPASGAFADLDLLNRGATLRLLAPNGVLADVVLAPGAYGGPGTAGWVRANARTWRHHDLTGGPAHRSKLVLQDRGKGLPGGVVSVTLRRYGVSLPSDQTWLPRIQAMVLLGDAVDGAAGRCGQSSHHVLRCGFRPSGVFKCTP